MFPLTKGAIYSARVVVLKPSKKQFEFVL